MVFLLVFLLLWLADLSLHFLAKMKILVVTDIERDDVEFIASECEPMFIA